MKYTAICLDTNRRFLEIFDNYGLAFQSWRTNHSTRGTVFFVADPDKNRPEVAIWTVWVTPFDGQPAKQIGFIEGHVVKTEAIPL